MITQKSMIAQSEINGLMHDSPSRGSLKSPRTDKTKRNNCVDPLSSATATPSSRNSSGSKDGMMKSSKRKLVVGSSRPQSPATLNLDNSTSEKASLKAPPRRVSKTSSTVTATTTASSATASTSAANTAKSTTPSSIPPKSPVLIKSPKPMPVPRSPQPKPKSPLGTKVSSPPLSSSAMQKRPSTSSFSKSPKFKAVTTQQKPKQQSKQPSHSHLNVAHVSWSDVTFHGLLGGGSFCSVFKVRVKNNKIPLPPPAAAAKGVSATDNTTTTTNDDEVTTSKAQQPEQEQEQPYYALKCLSDCALQRDRDYAVAALDLAFEAKLLSQLRHENIITLYGTNYADNPGETRNRSKLILILGLLEETLQQKLVRWRAKKIKKNITISVFGSPSSTPNNNGSQRGVAGNEPTYRVSTSDVVERIESTAIGISRGMAYLAKNNIVLRDLKPDNVGYDAAGNVKLFDFGLAQFQKKSTNPEMAGSLRYMAPENGLKKGCDVQSDVYSFGILLWELCTLKKPFSQLTTIEAFRETVFKGNHRPNVKEIVSRHGQELATLIQECWDGDRTCRPTFSSILKERLPNLINQLSEKQGMNTSRKTPKRRSTFGSNRNLSNHSASSNNSDKSENDSDQARKEGQSKASRRRGRRTARKQRKNQSRRSASLDPVNMDKVKKRTEEGEEEERGRPARSSRGGIVKRARSLSASFRRLLTSSGRSTVSSRRRRGNRQDDDRRDSSKASSESEQEEEASRPPTTRRRGVRRTTSLSSSFRKFLANATSGKALSSRRRRANQSDRKNELDGDNVLLFVDNKNTSRTKVEESETRPSSLSETEMEDDVNNNKNASNEYDISRNRRSVTRGLFRRMSMESPGTESNFDPRQGKYRRTRSTDLEDI